ncbi:hypothetical protein CLAFUW4_14428 [Fulvia fulva]|uniref:Apple domain-containing protein n=1 Tax=Passalora fulva TaxID=5499 RepID=A0A9Q8UWG6_PASFU|nr:uncharacterized protein CLAFUR5_14260 [Fulvia fulva]KAK4609388.1 hypothetical protein CLAFUR4_14424 [Fulvia fulva]UJO24882.1 hypothetical protein CLAFUR5_14260 [Fulvia fulva]WPV22980.1 hypothetical protein CLAFUW4_14428 [Fulvia fulva]WPV37371.1 hypothetical protein CLAFUW7_14433 [Fulvia fulva]
MQLIDFALIGLAIAAPTTHSASIKEATTCPRLQGGQVLSNNNQAYKLDCAKWVDAEADAVLRIVTTKLGYKGCLTACDGTIDCAISQYIATDEAQTKGSCTLFKKGVSVKQGTSNSWTLATKIEKEEKPSPRPAPKPKDQTKPKPKPNDPLARPGKDDKFGLIAISSGSRVHRTGITAAHGRISIGGKQDASCDKDSDFATFYVKDSKA